MTLMQASELGRPGSDILEHLDELNHYLKDIRAVKGKRGDEWDDLDHYKEYMGNTIEMIRYRLTYLTEK